MLGVTLDAKLDVIKFATAVGMCLMVHWDLSHWIDDGYKRGLKSGNGQGSHDGGLAPSHKLSRSTPSTRFPPPPRK